MWHASSSLSTWDVVCISMAVSMAYVIVGVEVADVAHAVLPPPSLHPTSSSSHFLLVLLFLCPVVIGVHGRC